MRKTNKGSTDHVSHDLVLTLCELDPHTWLKFCKLCWMLVYLNASQESTAHTLPVSDKLDGQP